MFCMIPLSQFPVSLDFFPLIISLLLLTVARSAAGLQQGADTSVRAVHAYYSRFHSY